MPPFTGLAGVLAGGTAQAEELRRRRLAEQQDTEQQEIQRIAMMNALASNDVTTAPENITAELPDVSTIGGTMPRRAPQQVNTGVRDPQRYQSLGRAGGQEYFRDRARSIAAQRQAERAAKIEEALRRSQIDENEARAFDLRRPETPSLQHVPTDAGIMNFNPKDGRYSPAAGPDGRPLRSPANSSQYRDMSAAASLRGQYNSEQTVKDAAQVATAYRKIREAVNNPSAAGDMSIIFGYMRMQDPNSTVREGEFATAQNSAGWSDQVRNQYNRALKGERLNADQRQDFLNQASLMVRAQRQSLQGIARRYGEIAQRNGMNPRDIVFDPFENASGGSGLPFPNY